MSVNSSSGVHKFNGMVNTGMWGHTMEECPPCLYMDPWSECMDDCAGSHMIFFEWWAAVVSRRRPFTSYRDRVVKGRRRETRAAVLEHLCELQGACSQELASGMCPPCQTPKLRCLLHGHDDSYVYCRMRISILMKYYQEWIIIQCILYYTFGLCLNRDSSTCTMTPAPPRITSVPLPVLWHLHLPELPVFPTRWLSTPLGAIYRRHAVLLSTFTSSAASFTGYCLIQKWSSKSHFCSVSRDLEKKFLALVLTCMSGITTPHHRSHLVGFLVSLGRDRMCSLVT